MLSSRHKILGTAIKGDTPLVVTCDAAQDCARDTKLLLGGAFAASEGVLPPEFLSYDHLLGTNTTHIQRNVPLLFTDSLHSNQLDLTFFVNPHRTSLVVSHPSAPALITAIVM